MNKHRNRYIALLVGLSLVLVVLWLVPGKDEAISEAVISTENSHVPESAVGKGIANNIAVGDVLPQAGLADRPNPDKQQDDNLASEMDEDYKKYILDFTTPITESIHGLITLANEGNGDALLKLLGAAGECREHKTPEYCPGTGLAEMGDVPGYYYVVLRKAAEQGSSMAAVILVEAIPSPFKNKQEMQQDVFKRALFSEILADHNMAVREHLDIAAQRGHLTALMTSAYYYSSRTDVDPDREKAAFYLLAWQELAIIDFPGAIISADLQASVLDPMNADAYARVQYRAERFAAQFKP